MSASRERKKRLELAAAGQSPKQLKKAAEKKQKRKNLTAGIISIVLVLAIAIGCVYGFVIRPNTMPKKAVALRTGDHEISAVDFGYYYYDAINTFYQNYGGYLSYLMEDPSKPLNEQIYDEESGQTWADYFMDGAAQNAKMDYACYDAAMKEGFKLSEEGEASIKEGLESLEASAKENGYRSLDDYFSQVYGKGSSKKSYEAYQRLHMIATEYAKSIDDARTYTDEEIAAKDAENPAKYSNVTYRTFYIGASAYKEDLGEDATEEETNAAQEAALAAAKADADKMVAEVNGDEAKFAEMAVELASEANKANYEDPDSTLRTNDSYDNVSSYLTDWLFDAARKTGDTAAIEDGGNGYYVVLFLSTGDNHYNTVNVRHILFQPEVDEDADGDGTADTSSTEATEAARAEAEKALADWQSGDATEESFAAMADEMSDDTAEGGLYEGVAKGQMITEFNDWIFDSARKPGDVEIVDTSYGSHIIYFVSEGDDYRNSMIISDLKDASYDEWSTAIVEGYETELVDAGTAYLHTDLVLGSNAQA